MDTKTYPTALSSREVASSQDDDHNDDASKKKGSVATAPQDSTSSGVDGESVPLKANGISGSSSEQVDQSRKSVGPGDRKPSNRSINRVFSARWPNIWNRGSQESSNVSQRSVGDGEQKSYATANVEKTDTISSRGFHYSSANPESAKSDAKMDSIDDQSSKKPTAIGSRASSPNIISTSSGQGSDILKRSVSDDNLGKPKSRISDEKTKSQRASRPGVFSVSSGREAALLDAKISQRSLGDESVENFSGSRSSVRRADEKATDSCPRATRPGIVSVSSGREAVLLDKKSSHMSLGDGSLDDLSRSGRRRADEKAGGGQRASRPGVVSVSSGREAALLDAKVSRSSLTDDSTEDLVGSRLMEDEKHSGGPRPSRPDIVTVSAGREAALLNVRADEKIPPENNLRLSMSSEKEAALLDARISQRSLGDDSDKVYRKRGERRTDEKLGAKGSEASRPGVVSVSSGRELTLLDSKISQRSLGDNSVDDLSRSSARRVDQKPAAKRASRPGGMSVSSKRELAPLDSMISQRSLGDESIGAGSRSSVRRADQESEAKRASRPGVMAVSSKTELAQLDSMISQRSLGDDSIGAGSRSSVRRADQKPASRPGVMAVSSKTELAQLDLMISQRSLGDDSIDAASRSSARRADQKPEANRASRPGVVSMSSAKGAAQLDTKLCSQRSLGDDSIGATSRSSARRADQKPAVARASRPGVVAMLSARGAAQLDTKLSSQRSLGDDSANDLGRSGRKADEKSSARGPRALAPGVVSVSSGREASLLDAKISSRRSLGDESINLERKLDEKCSTGEPRASRPGVVKVSSRREAALLDAKISQRSLGDGSVDNVSISSLGCRALGGDQPKKSDDRQIVEGKAFLPELSSRDGMEIIIGHENSTDPYGSNSAREAFVLDQRISERFLDENAGSQLLSNGEDGGKSENQRFRPGVLAMVSHSSFQSIPEDYGIEVEYDDASSFAGSFDGIKEAAKQEHSEGSYDIASAVSSKPGAFTASFSSLGGSREDLDCDIVAKQRARSRPGPTPMLSESSLLEHRIAVKTAAEDESTNQRSSQQRPSYMTQISSRFGLRSGSRQNSRRVLMTLDDRIAEKMASFGFTPPKRMTENVAMKESKKKDESSSAFNDPSCQFRTNPTGSPWMLDDDIEYAEFGGQKEDGLAVAFAIEEEEDAYIPSAVEFDPDAKPPVTKNRRFRLYFILINIAAITGILGTAIGLKMAAGKTKRGIPFRETLGIRENIVVTLKNESLLLNKRSSFSQALDWITYEDPLQLLPSNSTFVQRYLLAAFYFSTTEEGEWEAGCSPPDDGIGGPCYFKELVETSTTILVEPTSPTMYLSKGGGSQWLSDVPECRWAGIHCDEFGQVRSVHFSGANMTGSFPDSMELFPFLQGIEMRFNNFKSGPLPKGLARAKHITSLDLKDNKLTGSVPSQLYKSRSLRFVNLAQNELEGALDKTLGSLKDATQIDMSSNLLTGTIPSEIASLKSLSLLKLNHNDMSGSIPVELLRLPKIAKLTLSSNDLTGSLPSGFWTTSLEYFFADSNKISGSIPDALLGNLGIYRINLQHNVLTGTISTRFSNLNELKLLLINNNLFSGTIPSALGELPFLLDVWLEGNDFQGSVPMELCTLAREDKKYWVLDTLSADCLADRSGIAKITCDCCTRCYEANG